MKNRILKTLFVLCFVFILLFTSFKTNAGSDEKTETKEETEEKIEEPIKEILEVEKTEDDTSVEIEEAVIETKKPSKSNKEDVKPSEPVKKEEVKEEDISNSETTETETETETAGYIEYTMPSTSGFKSYMSYKAITSTSSPQYKLQRQYAYTGDYGIRQVDGRYCIAIGKFSNSSVGTYVDLVLENGTVIPCIIGDFKANVHTDSNNMVTSHNGCVSEFVVDMGYLNTTAKKMGDMSYCTDAWRSPVKLIRVYDKNVFG